MLLSLSVLGQQHVEVNRYDNQRELTSKNSITFKPGFTVAAGSNFRAYITSDASPNVGTKLNMQMNGIVIYTAKQPGIKNLADTTNSIGQVAVEVQTMDHFGRLKETQQIKVTPAYDDLVQVKQYDALGNEPKVNLPYVKTTGSPNFSDQGYTAIGNSYYGSLDRSTSATKAGNGYYELQYDNSPLAPVIEQAAPGADFSIINHHTKRTDLLPPNTETDVTNFYASAGALYKTSGPYDKQNPAALRTIRTEDENVPYHDQLQPNSPYMQVSAVGSVRQSNNYLDQLVIRKHFGQNGDTLRTFYVYDTRGNLCFVLPPKYPSVPGVIDVAALNALAYQYRYDNQNRMIAKKLPGKGWEYMVYNKNDQVVMTQDAVQRDKANQQWSVIKYDSQGRPAITGLFTHTGAGIGADHRATMQASVDAQTAQWETRTSSGIGYTSSTYPTTLSATLSTNYYDDYSFAGTNPYPYAAGSKLTRGMLTGTKTYVLGTTTPMWTVTYYDDKGRSIKTFKQHYKGGANNVNNYDELTTTYDFTGQPLTVNRSHKVGGTETLKTLNEYTYDHVGRKIDSWQTINTGTRTLLARNQYDELGMLFKKHLHSTNGTNFLQTITYHYNERGWLTDAEADKFNLKLRYSQVAKGGTPQYNGNIAEQQYNSPQNGNKWFTYKYDKYNRLTEADYKDTLNTANGVLNEKLTYDLNGNITTLIRGSIEGPATTNYSYANTNSSNLLSSTTGGNASNYTYDVNGNQLSDSRRSVTNMVYNQLNLPQTVTGTGKSATYTYNAAGNKLRSVQTIGSSTTTREYIDGVQYSNNAIEFIITEEGRARLSGGTYQYEYDLKDHLGNNRVTINELAGVANVVQEDEYYAFGLNAPRTRVGTENKYLYNGKEEQDVLQDELDYGARFYDPVVGRWNVIDPLAETMRRHSPYNYGFNNPMRFTDPDGMAPCDGCGVMNEADFTSTGSILGDVMQAAVDGATSLVFSMASLGNKIMFPGSTMQKASFGYNNGERTMVQTPVSGFVDGAQALTSSALDVASLWPTSGATAGLFAKAPGVIQSAKAVVKEAVSAEKSVLAAGDAARIENAATRIGKPITVVGSRASGTATAKSDWDYFIPGMKNAEWKKVKNSLPGAASSADNTKRNIDVFKQGLDKKKPHLTIEPRN
jgi:RHS repeat-associated protein